MWRVDITRYHLDLSPGFDPSKSQPVNPPALMASTALHRYNGPFSGSERSGCVTALGPTPSLSAARTNTSASIGWDFPRSRPPSRALAINLGGRRNRLAATDHNRFKLPDTCRTSSVTDGPLSVKLTCPVQQLTEPVTPRGSRSLSDLHPKRIDRNA
jgi:hypothetical protein